MRNTQDNICAICQGANKGATNLKDTVFVCKQCKDDYADFMQDEWVIFSIDAERDRRNLERRETVHNANAVEIRQFAKIAESEAPKGIAAETYLTHIATDTPASVEVQALNAASFDDFMARYDQVNKVIDEISQAGIVQYRSPQWWALFALMVHTANEYVAHYDRLAHNNMADPVIQRFMFNRQRIAHNSAIVDSDKRFQKLLRAGKQIVREYYFKKRLPRP